jgi:predicted dehydrogenase
LNLWQHFASAADCGKVSQVSADITFVDDGRVRYDSMAALQLRTNKGMMGRVIQDVVSQPVRKRALIQGTEGVIEWVCGWKPGVDAVTFTSHGSETHIQQFAKTRPEDFINEIRHLEEQLSGKKTISPIDGRFGIETMKVVQAAFRSYETSAFVSLPC